METLKTVNEIAPRLGLSTERVYELIRKGFFPSKVVYKFGRQIRINEERLVEFLENGAEPEGNDLKVGGHK